MGSTLRSATGDHQNVFSSDAPRPSGHTVGVPLPPSLCGIAGPVLQASFANGVEDTRFWCSFSHVSSKKQRSISLVLHGAVFVRLYRDMSVENRARLLSASQLGSGDFLRAVPSNPLFRMDGSSFVTALSLRVGVDLLAMVDVDRCACGAVIPNSSGSHYLTCRHRGWHIIVHDRLRDTLLEMLRQVVPPSRIRVPDRNLADDESWRIYSPHRRPDLVVLDWLGWPWFSPHH